MISERRQIAERFLSEGNGEAARIQGNRVRDLNKVQSEAYRAVEEIRGAADAAAAEIYAGAYNVDAVSVEFYDFTRTMQAYGDMISDDTTLVLTTDSDLFRFLRGMQVGGKTVRDPFTAPGDGGLASASNDRPQTGALAPIATRTEAGPSQ
jgi:membrane protease subunit HflC